MANKKTSDYAAIPSGLIASTWLYDIANPGVVNYKATQSEVSQNVGDEIVTGLITTATSIIGGINEVKSEIPIGKTESFIATAGQTLFTITVGTPSNPSVAKLSVNGQLREYGASNDFTISGTTITWYNNNYTLQNGDLIQIWFGETLAGGAPVSSVFGRTGIVVAAASDYNASQIDNDSGVTGTFVSDALDQLDTDITTHTGAANPHSGSAASGANSDITSLSGLTTPLSIAQGGTNSGAALTNGKVLQSSGGAMVESSVDISSLSATKSYITPAEPSANYNNRRVRAIGATGAFRMNFSIPKNFTGTLALKLIGYPVSGAGGVGKDIDLTGEYTNSAGASATQYTFSDTTSTYNTGTDDTRMELDITSLFTNITAGSEGGILVDHKGIGGTINYIGIEVTST